MARPPFLMRFYTKFSQPRLDPDSNRAVFTMTVNRRSPFYWLDLSLYIVRERGPFFLLIAFLVLIRRAIKSVWRHRVFIAQVLLYLAMFLGGIWVYWRLTP